MVLKYTLYFALEFNYSKQLVCFTLKFGLINVFLFRLFFLPLIRACLSTYDHTIHDDNDTTILPFPRIQCSSSYYRNDSNITMDEQAELISLKYLRSHQLISEGITLPPVVTKDTEVSMATKQYLQRHGLDDTSVVEQMKPYNSSNGDSHNNNMVLDIKRLRSLPKLY